MDTAIESPRQVAILTLAVLAVTIAVSVGFASLTQNPLVPDATLNATDADDRSNASRTEPVRWFNIEHVEGEQINASEIEIILWSRYNGVVLNQTRNWTDTYREFRYRLRAADGTAPPARIESGDRLVVTYQRVTGLTSREEATYRVRVRVYHPPSRKVILDQELRTVVGA